MTKLKHVVPIEPRPPLVGCLVRNSVTRNVDVPMPDAQQTAPSDLARRRAAAAARMRESRARRRAGFMVVSMEISRAEIASLVHYGLLASDHQAIPYEVSDALVRLIERELGGGT